ncbi:MAG: cell division protein FtsQ [Rhodocyclaceae bacterium]|nr:cell division protein FtsQ [Rhodocyclaceae bacterium]
MWNKPHLLNAFADLLFVAAAAALLAAAAVWLARMPALPIRQVVFAEELQHVRRLEVEQVLPAALKGNFFSINLEAVRGALEKLPWVRKVEVRRVWPARLDVRVEEHRPAARWEDGRTPSRGELVNTYGEVFPAALAEGEGAGLPMLYGPVGTAPELLRRYGEFSAALRPVGHRPVQVVQSPRLAWQLKLDNGMVVELGREQPRAPLGTRLQRFVEVYPSAVAGRPVLPSAVDLRYPNGFAMRVAGTEVKGK